MHASWRFGWLLWSRNFQPIARGGQILVASKRSNSYDRLARNPALRVSAIRFGLQMQSYRYTSIGGRYYCQQQSLVKLAGLLLFSRKLCPDFVDWKLLLRLLLDRMKIRRRPVKLELAVFGSWCLRARCGYKVMDPYSRVATKIFYDDVDGELIRKEIEQHRYIGQFDLAPPIKNWDVEGRWYQEEYLYGKTGYYFSPKSSREFMEIYYKDVAPFLVRLMCFGDSHRITIKHRMAAMDAEIRKQLDVLIEESPEIAASATEFYDYLVRELDARGNDEIFLGFAHGDFHLFNMFRTASGLKLIDWEGIGEQSLMYDFYNYFFSHLWLGRSKNSLKNEVENAVRDMASRLESINADAALSLSKKSNVYRMMYYFERIYAISTIFKSTPRSFLGWINVYRKFEADRQRLTAHG